MGMWKVREIPPRPIELLAEYLIFYSDRPDVPDKEWHLEGAQGDSLTATITGLLPKVVYYFKIQARNSKGYGPLSSVVQFLPGSRPIA